MFKKALVGFLKYLVGEEQEPIHKPEPKETKQQPISNAEIGENTVVVEPKRNDNGQIKKKTKSNRKKPIEGEIITTDPKNLRDIVDLMEFPFVALSKNRTTPIIYESVDGKSKIKVSGHREHYLASIYDWDIILFVASKLQEIINDGSDIPPRSIIVPRHELLKWIHKHDGKKEEKDLKESLARLKLTGIETTIRNEDGTYEAGHGFIDSWGYTDRKDVREFRITLSEWLHALCCRKGALLKSHPEYFKITSGLKRFLYRTARKHVGTQNKSWTFPIETLHRKSGSEREFKKFKHDLKKIVKENNLPGYLLEWIENDNQTSVRFINTRKEIKEALSSDRSTPEM